MMDGGELENKKDFEENRSQEALKALNLWKPGTSNSSVELQNITVAWNGWRNGRQKCSA